MWFASVSAKNRERLIAHDAIIELFSITLGADKGYDAEEFIRACRDMGVIPHMARNTSGRRSAVPDAIAASAGYVLFTKKMRRIKLHAPTESDYRLP